jgi:four helix bundle protein
MGRGVQRFTQLRAWRACDEYKKAIYRICRESALAGDRDRRGQLDRSAAGPPAHTAEGFRRFNPLDFARFVVIARASLMESQNHLRDAADKSYITEDVRLDLELLAPAALQETAGLLEYLQSPEAVGNARRARERRLSRRDEGHRREPN